jgi:hypothetical protein
MELTYMVRGADGKQYGPATQDQIGGWIREGRLQPQAEVRRSDMEHWASASEFLEFQPVFAPPAPAPVPVTGAPAQPVVRKSPATAAQLKSGASWFYWVAGLSLINSIAAISGGDWRFFIGLGITQLFDAFGNQVASGGKMIALALDLLVAGVFILFGVLANKGHTWAFLVGMILFALDGLIFLLVQDWIGVGFHALVLYWLFRGFSACRQLRTVT